MIMIEVSTRKNSVLEPGKTIEYLQGEILTIQLTQWGILGKIKNEEGVYNYRLKDPELKKKLILGILYQILTIIPFSSRTNQHNFLKC